MDYKKIKTLEQLKKVKNAFFGPDSELKKMQMQIRTASIETKKVLGNKIQKLKTETEKMFQSIQKRIEKEKIKKQIAAEWEEVSSPISNLSSLHPITLVKKRFASWLIKHNYYETKSSEIEEDKYNFERLNIPLDHPSRDLHDSLYITSNRLLRTHNTSSTARELAKNANKAFKQFTIGNVYRNDEDDATHSHQFTQLDLVAIGLYTFPNLIWTLKNMLSYVLEQNVEIRLRPSFFPFTEPSVEVDVFYNNKWIEILGAGMVQAKVLKMAGYNNNMNGFAAGIGIERVAMIKYNISEIREFYKNDLRFLNQFKGEK